MFDGMGQIEKLRERGKLIEVDETELGVSTWHNT